ncbi:MAG: glycerol-3-phosphate dehydrogenase, anaerobic, subunit [Firmicutes bacterium]|nr:glycerol-3-phosphate dehydrogenase, anaerobic, subunit [Bacillota bacterium]
MKKTDMIVIGGGVSGMISAIAAAKRGKKVTLLRYGLGAFEIGGGLIDIMAHPQDKKVCSTIKHSMDKIGEEHPYRKLGLPAIEEAVQFFLELSKEENFAYEGSTEKLHWVPTAVGTMKPTGLHTKTFNGQILKDADTIYLVDFKGLKDYYAKLTEKNLRKIFGEDKAYKVVTVDPHMEEAVGGRDIMIMDIARWLDTPEGLAECSKQLKHLVKANAAIVFPQVLGTKPDYTVYETLKAELQCELTETLSIPPSAAGMRLSEMLHNCARKYGVKIIENAKVIDSIVEDDVCEAVVVSGVGKEHTYYGEQFVLATGGFYGSGLDVLGVKKINEPIFDLPINFATNTEKWGNLELFSEEKQPFAMAGIQVDSKMHPLNHKGEQILKNVFVVGRNLSGYDFAFEKSGNGVALASAHQVATAVVGVEQNV